VSVAGKSQLLGVTEQLLHDEFRYAGSLGPLTLDDGMRSAHTRLGEVLTAAFDLVGVWGVDVVCNDEGIWPVEINPRYTASMEVLERATRVSTIACHVEACRDGLLPSAQSLPPGPWHGKAIVNADQDVLITQDVASHFDELNRDAAWPAVADLPAAGTTIRRGHPICTAFAEADTRERLAAALDARSRAILASGHTAQLRLPSKLGLEGE
jgi:predicted ATP-grasp superfamily ATP-dependent carboligase